MVTICSDNDNSFRREMRLYLIFPCKTKAVEPLYTPIRAVRLKSSHVAPLEWRLRVRHISRKKLERVLGAVVVLLSKRNLMRAIIESYMVRRLSCPELMALSFFGERVKTRAFGNCARNTGISALDLGS